MLRIAPRRASAQAAADERRALGRAETYSEGKPFVSPTLVLGLAGSLLLWAAFPPLDLPYLAWLAPLPWLGLVQLPALPGWRPYVTLWLAGCVHWLLMLQGIRLAHPALYAGWIALAAYLAVYLPFFIGLTRVAVHRWRLSLVVAAPVVWVGLELIRGHLITGFSMALLAHTQAEFPRLIQISDLAGGYTLSFVLMLVAACLARMLPWPPRAFALPSRWWPLVVCTLAVGITLGYGKWRLDQQPPGASGPAARVALIQGSRDTIFDFSSERAREIFEHYEELTNQATNAYQNLDLIVWPESMFIAAEQIAAEPLESTAEENVSADVLRRRLAEINADFQNLLAAQAAKANASTDSGHPGTHLLIGTTTYVYGPSSARRIYNSTLLLDRRGKVVSRYYKIHPVMFGEYIPFGELMPWLYDLTPMPGGLSVGDGPKAFEVAGLKFSPSICFESTIPHLIRDQVTELARCGTPTDVLVNLTNDGWFWGSAILDFHFRCGIFRTVENRTPLVVAANTGISAWIDGNGVVRDRGQKRQPKVVFARLQADGRESPYHRLGDLPAWLCAAACVAFALVPKVKT